VGGQLLLAGAFILAAWLTRERIIDMAKRPGFKKEPTAYRLKFEDAELEGLEVTARGLQLGEFLEINRLALLVDSESDPTELVRQSELLFTRFAGKLMDWNLEDENDQPVPAVYAQCRESGKPGKPGKPCSAHQDGQEPCEYTGVCSQELGFIQQIIKAWMSAMAGVPKASPSDSNGSGTYPELSIPMELASASQPS
jgi:hypothetical protein